MYQDLYELERVRIQVAPPDLSRGVPREAQVMYDPLVWYTVYRVYPTDGSGKRWDLIDKLPPFSFVVQNSPENHYELMPSMILVVKGREEEG